MRYRFGWPIGAIAVVCAQASYALDYNYSLFSSVEYTDNIRQVSEAVGADEAGRVIDAGLGLNLNTEPNVLLAANVSGSFARRYYSADELDSEDRKDLLASLLFQPSSNNFRLAVLESLQQVAADRRSVSTVNNLRDVNIFSVVPSYFIDLSPVSRIRTSASYSRVDEEFDLASREVRGATLGYQYRVSNLSTWSLNATRSNTEFTDTSQEYDQDTLFFRWSYVGRLTNWSLDLGQQRVDEREGADETLVSFSVEREVNNNAGVSLFYYQGYNDIVNNSVGNELTGMIPNRDAAFADELATERELSLGYDYARNNFDAGIDLFARNLESKEVFTIGRPVDEDEYGVRLSSGYRFRDENYNMSPYGLGLNYRHTREEFNLDGRENKIHELAIRLDYYASQSMRVYLQLRSRNTSGSGGSANSDEQSAMLGFTFSPRGGN